MPETIATQWLLAFLYSMPYVTCQIQTEQNQGKNMWAVEFKLQVRQTSLSRILHLNDPTQFEQVDETCRLGRVVLYSKSLGMAGVS